MSISTFSTLLLTFILIIYDVRHCTAVVNGIDACPHEYPFMVSIQNETGLHFCGGSLVSRKHVVTAAHCLYTDRSVFFSDEAVMYSIHDLTVRVGTTIIGGPHGFVYNVSHAEAFGHFNITNYQSNFGDIGWILLKEKVDVNHGTPIGIPVGPPVYWQKATALGWGFRSFGDPEFMEPSKTLQRLDMVVLDLEYCSKMFDYKPKPDLRNVSFIIDSIYAGSSFCAYKRGAGLCVRDSGSPIVQNGKLIGIVIFGIPCAKGFPDIFTNVFTYSGNLQNYMAHHP